MTDRTAFFVEPVQQSENRFDPILGSVVILLLAIGLGTLWSASWFRAQQLYGEPLRFILRQGMWTGVGLSFMLIATFSPLDLVRRGMPILVGLGLFVSILPFVPGISAQYLGAQRWIILFNVSFQPSEFVKVVLVLYLAHMLGRRKGDYSEPMTSLVPPALMVMLFAVITLIQNDYSTSVFLVMVALALFFAAEVPMRYFIRTVGLVGPMAVIFIFTREHRVRRLIAFINPRFDPAGSGFQILAARRALESGGTWGAGIGQGVRKIGGLPEAQSDFIFAVLGEELGYIGVILLVILFLIFGLRGVYLARRQEDWFRSLVIFGCSMSITLQALVNIAVVAGVIPATGIPLPFFSSGGSSLMVTLIMVGLIFNAAYTKPAEPASPVRRAAATRGVYV